MYPPSYKIKGPVLRKRIQILQVIPSFEAGGVEEGTLDVAKALVSAGNHALVTSAGGNKVPQLETIGAQHLTLPLNTKNPIKILGNVKRLCKIIQEHEIDLIHARSRAPAWSAYFAARKTNCPFVTTFHGAYKCQNPAKRFYNSVMAKGDRVIAISDYINDYITTNYSSKKILTIPRGIDCKRFDPNNISTDQLHQLRLKWQLPENVPIILLPARLTRIKGHTVLIKALSNLRNESFFCAIVGSDKDKSHYSQEVSQLIQDCDLSERIQIFDHCDDMPTAYQLADIVVSPSIVPEGFGRVVIEAQAMGKPVIASKLGATCELIESGKNGWLVPPEDPEALAQTLLSVLKLENKEALARLARQQVETKYSKELMCQKTINLYQELINQR